MIIDSQKYNGACSCGREHAMETQFCIVESGCLLNIEKYLAEYGIGGYTVAVYDENTYRATEGRHPKADKEVILDPTDLHANEHGVALLSERLPKEAQLLLAVGSGTIHDITRYCAYERGIDFVSCPTAASVDGFCSSVAAMTWHGCKKTLTAVAPKLVIADTDIIKCAPVRLTRSGFGDMIGKYIALTDWKIANILTGEFYCERIAQMTLDATEAVVGSLQGIIDGDGAAYENLIYGLLLSGLAMQMMTTSRPASGAEHHISHMIEMAPPCLHSTSDALHGEKVGVGTLIALSEYKKLAEIENATFEDYAPYSDEQIRELFGKGMAEEIFAENKKNSASEITAKRLAECWSDICAEIEKLPEPTSLEQMYASLEVKSTLADIDASDADYETLVKYSNLVRNRLTLMRLRKCIFA